MDADRQEGIQLLTELVVYCILHIYVIVKLLIRAQKEYIVQLDISGR